MINPISPELVYVIHKEKVENLEREIEMLRTAKERRAYETGSSFEEKRAWFAQASQWMKEKVLNRAAVGERASETYEAPCPTVPC